MIESANQDVFAAVLMNADQDLSGTRRQVATTNARARLELGDGATMWFRAVAPRLDLPYAHVDALATRVRDAATIERILLHRRIGYLGANQPVRYALICYVRRGNPDRVFADGAALDTREAWLFGARLRFEQFALDITRLLEQIAALPVCTTARSKISSAVVLSSAPSG